MALIGFVCNSSDVMASGTTDGCYGCFYRAVTSVIGPLQMVSLAQCAVNYLSGTVYENCATSLTVIKHISIIAISFECMLSFIYSKYKMYFSQYFCTIYIVQFSISWIKGHLKYFKCIFHTTKCYPG